MLTVAPSPALDPVSFAPGASQQQPALPLGTGTIVAGPDRVWDLARPVTLDGMLAGRDAATGQVSIQTALGTLVLNTQAALPNGGAISIQLTPGNPPTVTLLASPTIGSLAPQIAAQQPAVILQESALPAQTLLPGQIVTLVAIPNSTSVPLPIGNIAAPNPADTALSAGTATQAATPIPTALVASIVGTTGVSDAPTAPLPQPGANPAANTAQASIPLTTDAVLAAPASPMPAIPNTIPPVTALPVSPPTIPNQVGPSALPAPAADDMFMGLSSALAAQMPEIDTPGRASAQPQAMQPAAARTSSATPDATMTARILAVVSSDTPIPAAIEGIRGTVAGLTLGAQPILDTEDGRFVMQTAVSLPAGTQILFEAADVTSTRVKSLMPIDVHSGKGWPALDAALAALESIQSAQAAAAAIAIPRAGPMLAPLMLLFVAGLRSGDVRNWLGDKTLDALRRAGRGDIADALGSDFATAARQSSATVGDGWHSIPLPFLHQGEIDRLQLYLRRHSPDDSDSSNSNDQNGVRFMIELEPSAVGPIQLEGLVKRSTVPTTPSMLEMILRSRRPLPAEMRAEISRLFTTTAEAGGLSGHLAFQGENHWVTRNRDRQPSQVIA